MQEHSYSLLKNSANQLLLVVKAFSSPPPKPSLYYDGTSKALLKADDHKSMLLEHLFQDARDALLSHDQITVVELNDKGIAHEYVAPIVEADAVAV